MNVFDDLHFLVPPTVVLEMLSIFSSPHFDFPQGYTPTHGTGSNPYFYLLNLFAFLDNFNRMNYV